jgi:hypothetical protein
MVVRTTVLYRVIINLFMFVRTTVLYRVIINFLWLLELPFSTG